MREATIQIGDHVLTKAQSMAVRVAVSSFHMQCADEEFARELGPIAEGYKALLSEVFTVILKEAA